MKKYLYIAFLLICSFSALAQSQKTSQLPSATTPLTGTELVPLVQGGNNVKATVSDFQSSSAPGSNNQVIINQNGALSALSSTTTDKQAAASIHNAIASGISYDPRDPALGSNPAICHAPDSHVGDGGTLTFSYTTPFAGASTIDNSNFYVYTQNTNGSGTATVYNTSQFTVTGVNGGSGGNITLVGVSAPTASQTIYILHDDTNGFQNALAAGASSGGYISVPDNCWVKNMVAVNGGNMIGQGFSPNYSFNTHYQKPIMHIINPPNVTPSSGINIDGVASAFFEGFEIQGLYGITPLCIGGVGTAGAGAGQLPGIVIQYMTLDQCLVGFGSAIGASEKYIFATSRFNNYSADYNGTYGPLSDFQSVGDDFNAGNGGANFAGAYIGPQQGAPGVAGASRFEGDRFEFTGNGVICDGCSKVNIDGSQFDGNVNCGISLRNGYQGINITGGWFRGNANGGFSHYSGTTSSGQDAHVCLAGNSSTSGDVSFSNVHFYTQADENGGVTPIGTDNATTPVYVLDVSTTGADNNNISFNGGSMWFSNTTTNINASVWDTAIYRNGRPSNLSFNNVQGQPNQGVVANGQIPSQARGLPSNSWAGYYVVGDAYTINHQNAPLTSGYAGILAKNMNVAPKYFIQNDFGHFDCDVVQNEIIPNINPNVQDNAVVTWLPSQADPTYGGGSFAGHLADTHICHMGGLTWMAIPKKYKIYAQAGCTPTGSWTNSASYTGYYGLTSNTNADTLACPITTRGGPVYLWYQMDTTSNGTFTWQLDSTTTGSVTVKGSSALGSGTKSLGAVRIPVNSTGSHTINVAISSTTTSSNTVTIEGLGSPPNSAWHGSSPAVYIAGQANSAATNYPSAVTAFNQDIFDTANQLFGDGLSVIFADIRAKLDSANDYFTATNNSLTAVGQGHIADAFSAAMQYIPLTNGVVNPLDYGAACNTTQFTDQYISGGTTPHLLATTSGSSTITVSNYIFQPGTATQNGGGDVGKKISIYTRNNVDLGPTTYIASVTSGGASASISYNAAFTTTSGYAVMGGYPANPNDPSTAQDDTSAFTAASVAASIGGGITGNLTNTTGGAKVYVPNNCLVSNFAPSSGVNYFGSNGGTTYSSGGNVLNDPGSAATKLFISSNGNAEDPTYGINLTGTSHVSLNDFSIVGVPFPFFGWSGLTLACVGGSPGGALGFDAFTMNNMAIWNCPVGFGTPAGYNFPVTFTASISPDVDGVHGDMVVSAITSTNFIYATGAASDWLALGRTVTGAGVTFGTKIVSAPNKGDVGTYLVSLSQTVTSETMTSPASTNINAGSSTHNHIDANGIGYNGDFSDFSSTNDVFTGNFKSGWYMGPFVSGPGDGANRILGGRFEEDGTGWTCDGCTVTQLTGTQFQYNSGAAITTTGTTQEITMTGGMLQGNGGSNSAAQDKAEVQLGGAWSNFSFDGVEWYEAHSGGGPTSNYMLETTTGSTGDYLSIRGGNARFGFATAPFSFIGNTPKHMKVDVTGLAVLDSTITPTTSGLSLTSTAGGIYSETGLAGVTTAAGTFSLTGLPAAPNGWICQGGDITVSNTWPMSATTSTSCNMLATTTTSDAVWFSGKAN